MMRTELYEKHTVRFSIKDTLLVLWKKKKAKRGFVPRQGEHGTVESSSTLSLLQWKQSSGKEA